MFNNCFVLWNYFYFLTHNPQKNVKGFSNFTLATVQITIILCFVRKGRIGYKILDFLQIGKNRDEFGYAVRVASSARKDIVFMNTLTDRKYQNLIC